PPPLGGRVRVGGNASPDGDFTPTPALPPKGGGRKKSSPLWGENTFTTQFSLPKRQTVQQPSLKRRGAAPTPGVRICRPCAWRRRNRSARRRSGRRAPRGRPGRGG